MIAVGKSLALAVMKRRGVVCMDADRLWAELLRKGQPGYRAVVRQFGTGILGRKGEIDRGRLRESVFRSPQKLKRLERIAHPLICKAYSKFAGRLKARQSRRSWGICFEAALLLESPIRRRFKRIIVIKAPARLQLKRLSKRGIPEAVARSIIRQQRKRFKRLCLPKEKIVVIMNQSSKSALSRRLIEVIERIKKAG